MGGSTSEHGMPLRQEPDEEGRTRYCEPNVFCTGNALICAVGCALYQVERWCVPKSSKESRFVAGQDANLKVFTPVGVWRFYPQDGRRDESEPPVVRGRPEKPYQSLVVSLRFGNNSPDQGGPNPMVLMRNLDSDGA